MRLPLDQGRRTRSSARRVVLHEYTRKIGQGWSRPSRTAGRSRSRPGAARGGQPHAFAAKHANVTVDRAGERQQQHAERDLRPSIDGHGKAPSGRCRQTHVAAGRTCPTTHACIRVPAAGIDMDQAGASGGGEVLLHAGKVDEYARQQAQPQTHGDHAGDLADDLARCGIAGAIFHAQGGFGFLRMRRTIRTVADVAHVALHRCDENARHMERGVV